ncbi:tRNA (uridine(54)-C5)-methyltransferase TrmA [Alteromonas sp. 5E99-2]|uniref:tRNA (uridine(54)-C5)-methyltransferase TrmA n=1 Tax=Alteromonas sp. 5E99-2 TaxID=2817683 RepID=UPI001A994D85|nr:tRNA (uridine(54)-C5)-methyltransferase TrmA [Alteromonas sp. 5E99-2]MBO1254474.1 tRNA (uridine(54)-C5)-methyltransferase TrmA [Alteromonas sp. 5E99-2]
MANEVGMSPYTEQLTEKAETLSHLLSQFSAPQLSVHESAPEHYRMRAEFRVWHEGDDLYHIMFDKQTKSQYRVDQFPPACVQINKAMDVLIRYLRTNWVLRKKLFQIDYLSGLSGELVVSLLYHRKLDEEWEREIRILKESLESTLPINFIGRAKKQKIVIEQDYITEKLEISNTPYLFKHIENSFTQPNANVNIKMIEWAKSIAATCSGDLLELYCGAGNFSIPLSEDFHRVIGTEIAKPSVDAAQYNIEMNKVTNLDIVRLSAEEFVQALKGQRTFRRLAHVDLSEFKFETVLVDPPRAGLDEQTLSYIQDFDNIFYISCNPDTLIENLKTLCVTHDIKHAALFDQFPFTHHMESGVFLTRK